LAFGVFCLLFFLFLLHIIKAHTSTCMYTHTHISSSPLVLFLLAAAPVAQMWQLGCLVVRLLLADSAVSQHRSVRTHILTRRFLLVYLTTLISFQRLHLWLRCGSSAVCCSTFTRRLRCFTAPLCTHAHTYMPFFACLPNNPNFFPAAAPVAQMWQLGCLVVRLLLADSAAPQHRSVRPR
jgi:hypothetical protein